jgi:hypothetical protein
MKSTDTRSLGKCRNCKKGHRVDAASWTPSVKCECGATVKLSALVGYVDEHVNWRRPLPERHRPVVRLLVWRRQPRHQPLMMNTDTKETTMRSSDPEVINMNVGQALNDTNTALGRMVVRHRTEFEVRLATAQEFMAIDPSLSLEDALARVWGVEA